MARNKRKGEWIAAVLGVGLILALFQAGSVLYGKPAVFPPVDEIGRSLLDLLSQGKTYVKIGTTLGHVAEALAVSCLLGVVVGIAEGLIPYLHSLMRPLHAMLRSTPMIVMVIIIMVLSRPQVPLLTGCAVLVPIISEAAYEGCVRIEPELIDVYRLDSSIRPSIIFRVYLPLISGYMKQAFVNACGMGMKVIVTAEYVVQIRDSLGKTVYDRVYAYEYPELFAYGLIMVLLVLLLTGVPAGIIRITGKKKKSEVTSG